MKLSSPAFRDQDLIPDRFSRYHENRTPPLDFADVPREAQSLVLIVDDPDAPGGTFTHWVVFDIDANSGGFRENSLPKDVRLAKNSWGEAGYGGPRPPRGTHRYQFHLYALDRRPSLPEGVARAEVERGMRGHVLAEAELTGRYAAPV